MLPATTSIDRTQAKNVVPVDHPRRRTGYGYFPRHNYPPSHDRSLHTSPCHWSSPNPSLCLTDSWPTMRTSPTTNIIPTTDSACVVQKHRHGNFVSSMVRSNTTRDCFKVRFILVGFIYVLPVLPILCKVTQDDENDTGWRMISRELRVFALPMLVVTHLLVYNTPSTLVSIDNVLVGTNPPLPSWRFCPHTARPRRMVLPPTVHLMFWFNINIASANALSAQGFQFDKNIAQTPRQTITLCCWCCCFSMVSHFLAITRRRCSPSCLECRRY